ncbi:MAG TPA: alanyl-tRNA editing protein [Thermoplasmata archaeon]|nr:alanyl-tRNA editing protein [Thermoplasmata archaeon]
MTESAYLAPIEAAYERSFPAVVVSRPPGGLILDRTYFYPVGGGQPADQGWIVGESGARWPVTNVRRMGEEVVHALGRPQLPDARPLAIGERVRGEIDWERRYRHMRLHTAQHFVSAILFARTSLRTRAASLSGDRAVIDLEARWPAQVDWASVEAEIRDALRTHRDVRIEFVARAEWDREPSERSGAVPLAAKVDPVRVLEIHGVDRCPCGGTHVRNTREVGELQLMAPVDQAAGARVAFRLLGASDHSGRVTP